MIPGLCRYILISLVIAGSTIAACRQKEKAGHDRSSLAVASSSEPPVYGYNFSNALTVTLQKKLKEISGIHFLGGNNFAAIEDEDGIIYTLDFSTGRIVDEIKFAGAGDFEDIEITGKYFYVLESNGTIYEVARNGDLSTLNSHKIANNGGMEFESIYADASGDNLIMVCKSCPGKKKHNVDAYAYNLKTRQFSASPVYSLNVDALTADEMRGGVRPSAAAVHPVEHKLYVVCSNLRMLLVCDLSGKVEKSFHLKPALFEQPEGIAFTPSGDMYISNEAGKGKATIVKFVYEKVL